MQIEKFTQVLPNNWDGKFPFTNDSDEDFVFTWAKKSYLFPAHKTVDMMLMNFNSTPLEIQQIRKFAAKKFAEREFFKSDKYESLRQREGVKNAVGVITPQLGSFMGAGSFDDNDLKPYFARCLTPLPEGHALVADAEVRNIEAELHVDDDTGELVTVPVKDTKKSLAPGQILVN